MTVAERTLTPEHKEAMATGRRQTKIVNQYLTVVESDRPRRGRKRTVEGIQGQLDKIDAKLLNASAVTRLTLLTEREELNEELQRLGDNEKIQELEDQFIDVAKEFGDKKRIPYTLWKAFGVSDEVLDKAGISK